MQQLSKNKRKRFGKLCSAVNCNNFEGQMSTKYPGTKLRFHTFPKNDPQRSYEWLINLCRGDLDGMNPSDFYKKRVICSDHFENYAYNCPGDRQNSSLRWNAIPTQIDVPNTFVPLAHSRKCPSDFQSQTKPESSPIFSESFPSLMPQIGVDSEPPPSLAESDELSSDCDDYGSSGQLEYSGCETSQMTCFWKLPSDTIPCLCRFYTSEEVYSHVVEHHIKLFSFITACFWENCPKNQLDFKSQTHLLQHIRVHVGSSFQSDTFPYSKVLVSNKNIPTASRSFTNNINEQGLIKCQFCPQVFNSQGNLSRHIKIHAHSLIYERVCLWRRSILDSAMCMFRTDSWRELVEHVGSIHLPNDPKEMIKCLWKGCKRTTLIPNDRFIDHLGSHEVLNYSVFNSYSPTLHNNYGKVLKSSTKRLMSLLYSKDAPLHSTESKYSVCRICNESFLKVQYIRHMRNHAHDTKTKRFCLWRSNGNSNCPFVFWNWLSLVKHIKMVHINHCDENSITCKWKGCEKPGPYMSRYFLQHITCHDTAFTYKCNYLKCGKVFSNRQQLKSHRNSHDKKSLICMWLTNQKIICYEKLADPLAMNYHLRRHLNSESTGDLKCYWAGCPNEGSIFTKVDLLRHFQIHVSHQNKPSCIFVPSDIVQPKHNFWDIRMKVKKARAHLNSIQNAKLNTKTKTGKTFRKKIRSSMNISSIESERNLQPIIDFPDEIEIPNMFESSNSYF